MKKTVAVILLFVIMFCAFYGLTFNVFNRALSSISSGVLDFSNWTVNLFYNTIGYYFEDFSPIKIPGTDNVQDDLDYVDSDHTECYLNYIREAGFSTILDNFIDKSLGDVILRSDLYEFEIKVSGKWYKITCVAFDYFDYEEYSQGFVIISSGYSSLVGQGFTLLNYPFFGYVGSFQGSIVTRDVRNRRMTYLTLADIEHECVLNAD